MKVLPGLALLYSEGSTFSWHHFVTIECRQIELKRTGVQATLKLVGEEQRTSRDIELGMFRIAQEALWNTERHSKATNVVVTFTFSKHEVRMDIKENGRGFNVPLNLSASGQLGLLGMQERAELLGGKFEIQSKPGKGVIITASLPFPEKRSYTPVKVKES